MKKLLIGLPLIVALLANGAAAQDRGRGGYGRGGYAHPEAAAPHAGPAFGRPGAERGYGGGAGYGAADFGAPRFGGGDRARAYPGAAYGGRGYGAAPAAPAYGRGYSTERFAAPAYRSPPAYAGGASRGSSGPAYGRPGPARGFTRGQLLPPAYWGGEVADPRVYHLRRPPNGYGWVTAGGTAYLTQRSTGLILDTAPLY